MSLIPLEIRSGELTIASGLDPDWTVVHKFGRNDAVGTNYTPVSLSGFYRTPQVSGATALRIKAGNTNDAPGGTGARKVTIQGLDETGAFVEEEIATNGSSAGSPTSTTFLRMFRAFVSESGTYATATAGSHAGDIVIENAAGSEDWAQISVAGFPRGQTEIGAYTVPLGYTAYVKGVRVVTDAAKTTEVTFFRRSNILETAAPYTAMREQVNFFVAGGAQEEAYFAPLGPFPALTDIGCLAKVDAGTAQVNVDFEILLYRPIPA